MSERLFGLDVLRAAAIALVVLAHCFALQAYLFHVPMTAQLMRLGVLGVELFFALSGFLIGTLLIEIALRAPTWREWLIFLARRWMRTLPLYFVWVVVLIALQPNLITKLNFLIGYLTLTQNLAWPMPTWFAVSWSLTVEEWFYLLFSGLLLGLTALWPRRALLLTCLVFIAVPLAARIVAPWVGPGWDTPMRRILVYRIDAIAYGVLIAWAYWFRPAALMHWRKILLGAGLMQVAAAIAITWWFKNDVVLHALAWTMLPLGFACCIPSFITLRDPGNAFAGLVRYLSTRSYGLYIVHLTFVFYALMAVQKGYAPAWLFTMIGIVPALLAAELSYRFIEMPILRRRPKQFVRARHVSEQPSKPDAFDAKGWRTHGPAPA